MQYPICSWETLPLKQCNWHEYASSVKVRKPLVEQIVSQSHQLPEDSLTKLAQQEARSERLKELE